MALLSREQILGSLDLATETVSVPEWGGEVIVRALTLGQQLSIQEQAGGDAGKDAALLVSMSVVDADGNPVFTAADAEALAGKRASALNAILSAAFRLNQSAATSADSLKKT